MHILELQLLGPMDALPRCTFRGLHLRRHIGSLTLSQFAAIRVMLSLLEEVALTSDESRKMLQVPE